MRKFISLAAAFIILGTALECCVQGVRLDALSEELQVDVTGAQVESWSDSHGGAGERRAHPLSAQLPRRH